MPNLDKVFMRVYKKKLKQIKKKSIITLDNVGDIIEEEKLKKK